MAAATVVREVLLTPAHLGPSAAGDWACRGTDTHANKDITMSNDTYSVRLFSVRAPSSSSLANAWYVPAFLQALLGRVPERILPERPLLSIVRQDGQPFDDVDFARLRQCQEVYLHGVES